MNIRQQEQVLDVTSEGFDGWSSIHLFQCW